MADEAQLEVAEQWELVNTPLGEKWSGRTRYAAAMFFYKRDEMTAAGFAYFSVGRPAGESAPTNSAGLRAIA